MQCKKLCVRCSNSFELKESRRTAGQTVLRSAFGGTGLQSVRRSGEAALWQTSVVAWFTRDKPGMEEAPEGERRVRTEGLWLKCEHCSQVIWRKALEDNFQVCPRCSHHFR